MDHQRYRAQHRHRILPVRNLQPDQPLERTDQGGQARKKFVSTPTFWVYRIGPAAVFYASGRGRRPHAHSRSQAMSSDIEDTIDIVRKGGDWLVYFRSDPVTFTDQARALRDWLEDMIPHCRDCCIDRVCDGCAASERAE